MENIETGRKLEEKGTMNFDISICTHLSSDRLPRACDAQINYMSIETIRGTDIGNYFYVIRFSFNNMLKYIRSHLQGTPRLL